MEKICGSYNIKYPIHQHQSIYVPTNNKLVCPYHFFFCSSFIIKSRKWSCLWRKSVVDTGGLMAALFYCFPFHSFTLYQTKTNCPDKRKKNWFPLPGNFHSTKRYLFSATLFFLKYLERKWTGKREKDQRKAKQTKENAHLLLRCGVGKVGFS